ncbi:MAG: hypothetical protein ACLR08_01330 [Dorea longicatena]
MDKYEKKYDSAVSETETDIRKLTDLLLKVGTQQFLETLSPYITGGEILLMVMTARLGNSHLTRKIKAGSRNAEQNLSRIR